MEVDQPEKSHPGQTQEDVPMVPTDQPPASIPPAQTHTVVPVASPEQTEMPDAETAQMPQPMEVTNPPQQAAEAAVPEPPAPQPEAQQPVAPLAQADVAPAAAPQQQQQSPSVDQTQQLANALMAALAQAQAAQAQKGIANPSPNPSPTYPAPPAAQQEGAAEASSSRAAAPPGGFGPAISSLTAKDVTPELLDNFVKRCEDNPSLLTKPDALHLLKMAAQRMHNMEMHAFNAAQNQLLSQQMGYDAFQHSVANLVSPGMRELFRQFLAESGGLPPVPGGARNGTASGSSGGSGSAKPQAEEGRSFLLKVGEKREEHAPKPAAQRLQGVACRLGGTGTEDHEHAAASPDQGPVSVELQPSPDALSLGGSAAAGSAGQCAASRSEMERVRRERYAALQQQQDEKKKEMEEMKKKEDARAAMFAGAGPRTAASQMKGPNYFK